VDHAISWQTMAALEGADCISGPAAQDAIDWARLKSSGCEPTLHLHNQRAIHAIAAALISAIPVWVVGPVRLRVVGIRVVGIRVVRRRIIERHERKAEVIENNDLVEMVEMTKPIIPTEIAVVETVEAGRGV
jgi:hypothetical protein